MSDEDQEKHERERDLGFEERVEEKKSGKKEEEKKKNGTNGKTNCAA